MKYLIVYEKSDSGWGAYAPDLPGLGVAAQSLEEVKDPIREAVEFHLAGMRQHGDPIPSAQRANRIHHGLITGGLKPTLFMTYLALSVIMSRVPQRLKASRLIA